MKRLRSRPGVTLVELLLFLGLMAITSSALIGFFFSTSENQLRQEALSDVDQNGAQLMQLFAYRVRHAERIRYPAKGATGSVLMLQMAPLEQDPTVIGVQSGAMLMDDAEQEYLLSDVDVTVKNFLVRNTSASATRQSLFISFDLEKTLPLAKNPTYTRHFESTFSLFPVDTTYGNSCNCTGMQCLGGVYVWGMCKDGTTCVSASGSLLCK